MPFTELFFTWKVLGIVARVAGAVLAVFSALAVAFPLQMATFAVFLLLVIAGLRWLPPDSGTPAARRPAAPRALAERVDPVVPF